MVSKMTSTSTGARPGKGRSGNSRLGFPFCISLASVEGRLTRLPLPLGPMSRSLAMLVRSLAVSLKADLAGLAGLSLANPEELSVVPNHL
jgi:hypothetical protein